MTTAVAVETENGVVLGVDSQISSLDDEGGVMSMSTVPRVWSKVIKFDGYAIAVAGDTRALNLLAHAFDGPSYKTTKLSNSDRWLTTTLIPALKETLEQHDYAIGGVSNKAASQGSQFLVATVNHAYIIEGDWGWAADRSGLYAIGTGSPFALGALHATVSRNSSLSVATKAANKALSVAAALDPYTGGPFHVIRVGKD